MQEEELVELCLITVPVQLPDDNTECNNNSSCVPGYVSTHSNGRKLAAGAPCVLCYHCVVLSLLLLILSYLRELKRKLRFFS